MKTQGGHEITNFKKLDEPIERGVLEPHIYSGNIKLTESIMVSNFKEEDIEITWDRFGKCSNFNRPDCFISEKDLELFLTETKDIKNTGEIRYKIALECIYRCYLYDCSGSGFGHCVMAAITKYALTGIYDENSEPWNIDEGDMHEIDYGKPIGFDKILAEYNKYQKELYQDI